MKSLEITPAIEPVIDKQKGIVTEPGWMGTVEAVKYAANSSPIDGQGRPMGHTPEDLLKRGRIIRACEKVEDDATVLELEDGDADKLVECLKTTRFTAWTEHIEAFICAVNELPSQKNGEATEDDKEDDDDVS